MTPSTNTPVLFSQGMTVRHRKRPEWGIGTVNRVETVTRGASRDQRLWIRFTNEGLKTLLASVAELEVVDASAPAAEHTFAAREMASAGGWLGEIAKSKPQEAMTQLPPDATDQFLTPERRLKNLLALYRFDAGAKLLEWAIVQSGLDDPMSRFPRIELEKFFKDWSLERDIQLHRLVTDFRRKRQPVDALLADAPKSALAALQKLDRHR